MSLLIEDKFNTIKNIERLLEDGEHLDKVKELYSRGIKLTPIQANMLFLDYPNFGGRAYGKSYMSMIKIFTNKAKTMKIGEYFIYTFSHSGENERIINFQREYYSEFKDTKITHNSVSFKKVR